MPKQVRALKEVWYASKTRHAGEVFSASDEDARLFVGFGTVELVEEAPKPKQPTPAPAPKLETAALKATTNEPPVMTTDDMPSTGRRKRSYLRRDMTPED